MAKLDGKDLYQVPELYEALLGADGGDEAFYRALAAEHGGPVLDLGCGTGRLSLALAADGHAVTGVDASAPMLAAAQAAARARGLQVDWRLARWEALDLPARYSLALLPYNGLQHLHEDAALRALSAGVRNALRPGGRWALDLHVPQPAILQRDPERWWPVEREPVRAPGLRVLAERSAYDAAAEIQTQTWRIERPGGSTFELDLGLKQYDPKALSERFKDLGWSILGLYEDFGLRPLGPFALRQIWVISAQND